MKRLIAGILLGGLVASTARAQQPAPEPKPSMEIYGFAMLDMGHDFEQIDPNWFDTLRVTKLPSFEHQFGEDNNTFAGVRQWGRRTNFSDGFHSDGLKVQFSFKYNFSAKIGG